MPDTFEKQQKRICSSLTFYDIQLNTINRCINLLNLVMESDQQHIFPQQHLKQHEHDTVTQVLYPNPMLQCIVVNSIEKY